MSKIRGVGGGGDAAGGHHSAGGNPHQVSGNSASSGGISGADRGTATSPVRHNPLTYQHGHSFIKKTFHKPTINCHFCAELLWGLMGQGYICEGKNPTFTFSYFSTFSCQKITFIFPFARQLFSLHFFLLSLEICCALSSERERKLLDSRSFVNGGKKERRRL